MTSQGAVRIVPVRGADMDGAQNEYNRTKEIGLIQGQDEWVRLYTDLENHCYKVFPAPAGVCRATMAGAQAREDLQAGVPRQRPADRW